MKISSSYSINSLFINIDANLIIKKKNRKLRKSKKINRENAIHYIVYINVFNNSCF
jgi:hypothetical protein